MQLFSLRTIVAFSQLTASILAIPVDPPGLIARSHLGDDAHTSVGGTPSISDSHAAVSESLDLRATTKPVIWRTPGSQTYVAITPIYDIGGLAIVHMIDAAAMWVYSLVSKGGDGPLSGGHFNWNGEGGLVLNAWGANNHQTTYGVLGAAIKALTSYFNANGYGRVTFLIFDGNNQVGEGIVG